MLPTTERLAELRRTVQALARPVEEQHELFPHFVCVPDELVLDFDEALRNLGGLDSDALSEAESEVLALLNALIERLSGPANAEFWTDEALSTDSRWEMIRERARGVLRVFGWPDERPPPGTAIYVGQHS